MTAMRSLADYEHHRAILPPLGWLLLVHLLAMSDPQGRVFRTLGQLARMVDVRGARISSLLDELSREGVLTWTRDADDGVRVHFT